MTPNLLLADIIEDIEQLTPKKPKGQTPPSTQPTSSSPSKPAVTDGNAAEPITQPDKTSQKSKASGEGSDPAKKAGERQRRDAPIHLQSDGTSTYSRNGSVVNLEKNVVITQEDLRLQSEQAKVVLASGEKKAGSNSVETVEVSGKVNLSRFAKDPTERITARSDKALFDNNSQKVTLDGNARLWKDGHLIKGDRIVYEILTGMIKVDRAQGIVQPERASK